MLRLLKLLAWRLATSLPRPVCACEAEATSIYTYGLADDFTKNSVLMFACEQHVPMIQVNAEGDEVLYFDDYSNVAARAYAHVFRSPEKH